MPERLASKVLLIGWDAADWKIITPLLEAGHMPTLERLVNRGVMGNLATLDPPFSPMLWTSIATGQTADRHGILNFIQPAEDGQGVRPVRGTTRRVKALWNILSQNGLRSNVVGWWPSHPAEPIHGAMVSNFYQRATAPVHEAWPMPVGTVHPPELADTLAALRVHPAELTGAHLAPFIPALDDIDQTEDKRVMSAAKIIADAATVHAAATFLMEETEWDFMAVYYDAIDHFGHGFMKYHPPRLPGMPEADFERYKHVVTAGYRFHDMMLDRLLDLAGEDTTVILLSDHGFHSDHLRPLAIPNIPAGPAVEHRTFGIVCMAGPGIKQDERIYGAGLLNVAPTVLTLFGLPLGRDMSAPPLVQAFEQMPEVAYLDSWEAVPGEDGRHPAAARANPWAEQEAMRQLIELGYVDAPDDDPAKAAANAARDSTFNLARVYFSTGRAEEAVPLFEQVYADASKHKVHYGVWLAHAYQQTGRLDDAERLAEEIRSGDSKPPPSLDLLLVDVALDRGDAERALSLLEALPDLPATSVEFRLRQATAYLYLSKFEDAADLYGQVLDADPDNARAHHGRAKAFIGLKRYEEAAEAALAAVSRLYRYPEAHFHLGVAMTRLGWAERAEQAFRVCLSQKPDLALAHRWLARLYRDYRKRPDLAALHAKQYRHARTAPLTQGPQQRTNQGTSAALAATPGA